MFQTAEYPFVWQNVVHLRSEPLSDLDHHSYYRLQTERKTKKIFEMLYSKNCGRNQMELLFGLPKTLFFITSQLCSISWSQRFTFANDSPFVTSYLIGYIQFIFLLLLKKFSHWNLHYNDTMCPSVVTAIDKKWLLLFNKGTIAKN